MPVKSHGHNYTHQLYLYSTSVARGKPEMPKNIYDWPRNGHSGLILHIITTHFSTGGEFFGPSKPFFQPHPPSKGPRPPAATGPQRRAVPHRARAVPGNRRAAGEPSHRRDSPRRRFRPVRRPHTFDAGPRFAPARRPGGSALSSFHRNPAPPGQGARALQPGHAQPRPHGNEALVNSVLSGSTQGKLTWGIGGGRFNPAD